MLKTAMVFLKSSGKDWQLAAIPKTQAELNGHTKLDFHPNRATGPSGTIFKDFGRFVDFLLMLRASFSIKIFFPVVLY